VDGQQKTTPKREKKSTLVLEFSLQTKSCRYTKPVHIFFYIYLRFYLLHPSKAHRICSVKMASYFKRPQIRSREYTGAIVARFVARWSEFGEGITMEGQLKVG
jgi:hypothetical protein